MALGDRVQRNPNVVWRRETRGGTSEGVLLFNYATQKIHFLNDPGGRIWEICEGRSPLEIGRELGAPDKEGEIESFLKDLEYRGLILAGAADAAGSRDRPGKAAEDGKGMWEGPVYFDAPLFVQFDCTNRCNLRCRHCVTDGGVERWDELTTEEASGLIETLGEMGVFQIGFSGGEPLMRPDIFELMAEVKRHGMKVQLTTNATLVDDDTADRIAEFDPVTVGVSLEGGTKGAYEYFRGSGNFERFLRGVKALKGQGLPVKFKGAIMRRNLGEMKAIAGLAMELGVEAVDLFLFYPQGRGAAMADEKLTPLEIRDFLTRLAGMKKELEGRLEIDVEDKPNAFLVDPGLSHSTCGAGAYWAEVLPDGSVVPCVFFRDVVAGNVRREGFRAAWRSEVWRPFRDRRGLKGRCGSCEHRARCGGGCRANGYMDGGDFLAEDGLCWYEGA
ncbi:MAG: radical SAM protein [Methanobacteriota archaeon]|nr:MAG: radical SAM protein [Euryarchaeota archaeon]